VEKPRVRTELAGIEAPRSCTHGVMWGRNGCPRAGAGGFQNEIRRLVDRAKRIMDRTEWCVSLFAGRARRWAVYLAKPMAPDGNSRGLRPRGKLRQGDAGDPAASPSPMPTEAAPTGR